MRKVPFIFAKKHIHLCRSLEIYLILAVVFVALPLRSQPESFNHPELRWRTIETEHFLIHYHQGTARTANVVARIAEEVYPYITRLYQYEPDGKIEFIIRDTDDYSNGGAYFFDNKIEIWAENLDYILRGTHNWLRDVVTHEFTHIISLQKALKFGRKIPAMWFQVFGYEEERRPDVIRGFPNVLISYPISGVVIPVWFAEGVAQFQSPSKRYDYRDSHREMILRDRVITNRLLDFKEMGVFGKNSIGNESAYNQGFAFVKYLSENFGDSVVKKISAAASSPGVVNFNSVLKKATGQSGDVLYRQWKQYLKENYTARLSVIRQHPVTGEPLIRRGIGNIFPTLSPNGKQLAYLTTGDGDYLSRNQLKIKDLQTGKEITVTGPVSSSLSWSPDGKFLVYAKQTDLQPNGSSYNDLYIYDVKKKKEYKITNALRARNPDWSHDGRRLTFVVSSDGVTNLFVLSFSDIRQLLNSKEWKVGYYDLKEHRIANAIPENQKKDEKLCYRRFTYRGGALTQLTYFVDGRQIYHPRWSPDDRTIVFDTSIGFGRDIAEIPAGGGTMRFLLNGKTDERYPVFRPGTSELFYASDETGIFNIYSYDLKTQRKEAHTNVVGGAFMPTVSAEGSLFYALYENQGYKIYRIDRVNSVPLAYLRYEENYAAQVPELALKGDNPPSLPSKPYRRRFTGISFMPRLLLDYGTVKPGLYFYVGDVLDKLSLFGGFDINKDQDINLFGIFNYRLQQWNLLLEFYNQTAHIEDNFQIEGYPQRINRGVSFNLLEADVGLQRKFASGLLQGLELQFYYTFSLYKAQSGIFSFQDPGTGFTYVSSPFRYTYLRGHSLRLHLKMEKVAPSVDRAINPTAGYYLGFQVSREWQRFLTDFATDRAVSAEVYSRFYYTRLTVNFEKYWRVPYSKYHSLTFQFRGGLIDRPVDDFFYFFAGGLIGLKGYPYFSIEGRKMAMGSVYYRFPIKRHINWQLWNIYFDKLYVAGFYQTGNAWDGAWQGVNDLKSDVGIQLRLETFSWYFFPTRIFFEAAYPLKEQVNRGIRYKKEWKFYVGILFDFNLRFEKRLRRFR